MTLSEIMFAIAESNPNCRRFRFETRTRPALTKKNRTTKEPTNFVVEIRSRFTASLGVNYEKEVNDLRESQGLARDFEAQKPSGKHYVKGTNWLMEADKTPGKYYVARSRFSDRTTKYLVDGVEADAARVADLKANYLPKSGPAPLVEWKTYSVDSIVSAEPL